MEQDQIGLDAYPHQIAHTLLKVTEERGIEPGESFLPDESQGNG